MGEDPRARTSFRWEVLLGAVVWLGVVAGTWSGWPQLGVIELLFLLAPWIVIPLATALIPSLDDSDPPTVLRPAARWIIFSSAVLAGLTYERLRATRWSKPLSMALTGVVVGPGLLGLAFLVGPKVKLAAVILIVLGQVGLASGMIRVALSKVNPAARGLLLFS